MKKIFLLFVSAVTLFSAKADEGMWIPMLIGKNYDEMQRLGLKLTKEDLYDINHSSMKDAILQFGGGCTAEMISSNGLLLTNHHCGYDAIAGLSTVDRNLLDDGFWAHKMDEELPAQGVTALFLQKMVDVTTEVKAAIGNSTGEELTKKFDAFRKTMEEKEAQNGKYVANVKEYFNGNQYFLLIYKRYTDVRLVGTPPRSLGKYGGDIDNWMWPRHTADFSMFRIYAGKDNEPHTYSLDNVPYHPGKYLPVSIKGVKEGDYAMIFGYPGRTNRYEVSYGVDLAVNTTNPAIVAIRDRRLAIIKKHMDADKSVYLQLTSLYSRIANYWKYFIGQTEQLKRLNVVDKKKATEDKYIAWASANGADATLMDKFSQAFSEYKPYAKHSVYYGECFRASALTRMASGLKPLYEYLQRAATPNADSVKKYGDMAKMNRRMLVKELEVATDKDIFAEMTQMYYENVPKDQLPDIYANVILAPKKVAPAVKGAKAKAAKVKGYEGNSYADYANYVYSHTFVTDSNAFNAFLEKPSLERMQEDAAVQYAMSFVQNYSRNYLPKIEVFTYRKAELAKQYVHGLMQWKTEKKFYPDANSTMRITYGTVKSYDPQDGVHYKYYTTLDGLMAKYKAGDEDFDAPKELVNLYNAKNYGRYADADGTLHTCFITNNDITGGNSGSPCINANGELIGAAFDGNWEAMSGDIAFDKQYKRTIVCDIRYILFLIDKMGHANNLIDEMEIRN
ncbi:MAG: S46 family peptidase [Chitinophagia bacterium]|nr:S46 family peptidase [Chitinophagia bacterium]